jgi:GDPmannose 4,6-dehydratase
MKTALITGISGQDGSYLAEYLLGLGYRVCGLVRREPGGMRWLAPIADQVELFYGDLRDAASIDVAFQKASPDEVYNLAGQVFVPTSWEHPGETFDINLGGFARILRIVERRKPDTCVYQASSSEMFGTVDGHCDETTPMHPISPYGISKTAAHRLCEVYRQRGLFVVGGILFDHESPRRGPEMVTRKITRAAGAWAHGDRTKLKLGSLETRRDWGFAGDYVKTMHAMLQQPIPKDYVIGTGESHSISDFVAQVLVELRALNGRFVFSTIEECVELDQGLQHQEGELCDLRADAALARHELGWKSQVEFTQLVRMMVHADVEALRRR